MMTDRVSPGEIKSRRGAAARAEMDSFDEASRPTETEKLKSREAVVLGWSGVGLLLLQLFPNGGATDIVFVTVLYSSWDNNC